MTKKREFNSRWGNAIADDFQYCHVPGYILRNYAKCVSLIDVTDDKGNLTIKRGQIVDLDMQDMMFVIHVMAFKYDAPKGKATPGLPTIAEYSGLHVTSVRRIKQKLMSYGLLSVESEIGRPDIYNFAGLHDQCVRLEQGLSALDGVETTPSKSASGSKIARGWASKSARGTTSKSASRRIKPESEEKKENKAGAHPLFNEMKTAIQKSFGWDMPTSNEWGLISKASKQLLEVNILPADIPSLFNHCKSQFDRFTPMAMVNNASAWRLVKPPVVHPSHVPFAPITTTPDDVPMTPEAQEAFKFLTTQFTDEEAYAKSA